MELADLFGRKIHQLAHPMNIDDENLGYVVQWKTLGKSTDEFQNKVQRLVVSSVLGCEDGSWDDKLTRGGDQDQREINTQIFLTLTAERFTVDRSQREIQIKNIFERIYRRPTTMDMRMLWPINGERRIFKDQVDPAWKSVFMDSLKNLQEDPHVKKINDLGILVLNKICNSDAPEQGNATQFNKFEEFVKSQPRR